jgi:hypothetical protein
MILYQLGDNLVIGIFNWGEDEIEIPKTTRIISSLGMQAYLFPFDPALPSLIQALDPGVISAAMAEALPAVRSGEARILRSRVKILRFRPGRRCTMRLDLWLRDQASGEVTRRIFFGKIYHDLEKAESVFHEMKSLSSTISTQDSRIALATASLFLPNLAMMLQNPMEGEPLDMFIDCDAVTPDPRGLDGILQAATALAALHTSGMTAGRVRSIQKELARFKKRGEKISRVNPKLGEEIISLADTLMGWCDSLEQWGARITVVHGDCKPAQFLIDEHQIALIDFDHVGMADPAGDVGTFLATLQQYKVLYTLKHRGKAPRCADWLPGVKQQFLDAYCASSKDPPGFKLRAIWYESVGLLRKAIRSFERSPFSLIPPALIADAKNLLDLLPPPGLF